MPPHCDSMDGPVVMAARRALEARAPQVVLPYVPKDAEDEVRHAFDAVIAIREHDPVVREVADRHFFETVVRLHRAGEGAPYTGLKPAGLDHGPVIPVAERALETGSPDELVELLSRRVEDQVRTRFAQVMDLKAKANGDLDINRAYVEAMLGLQVWSHSLYAAAGSSAHEHHHDHAG
jgi:uncharacterized protein DUF6448